MNRSLITTLALAAATVAFAGNTLDAGSRARLRSLRSGYSAVRHNDGSRHMMRSAAAAKTVGGFMTLNEGFSPAALADEAIEITPARGGVYLVRMNIEDVERIAALPAVANLRLERDVTAKMDRVRRAIGADRLHNGEVLSHPYTGKGVLCASVDGGFDPNHLNFRNPDGTSRIQNFTYFRPIQSGGMSTENYGPEYIPKIDTESSATFHGTHTLGIMAGGYRGKVKGASIDGDPSEPQSCKVLIEEIDNPYYGIAYESDIAVASGVSTDYYIAQGVNEILNYAYEHQQKTGKPYPVVINISMGSNLGPHDGSSYLAQYLDAVSEEEYTNNVICIASGNEGNLAICLNKTFSEDENTLLTGMRSYNPEPEEYPNVVAGQVYLYSDTDEPFELQAIVYNKERGSVVFRAVAGIPDAETGGSQIYYATSSDYVGYDTDILSPQLAQYFEGYIGVAGMVDTDESGRYFGVVDTMLWETEANNGNYVLLIQVKGKDGQRVDLYTDGNFFDLDNLGLADKGVVSGNSDGTVADTATGRNVVVVGSYNTRETWASLDGEIYYYDVPLAENEVSTFSSWGTLVDGRELPHVCAPGASIISSTNEYYLQDNGIGDDYLQAVAEADGRRYSWHQCVGTSMSTPVVSGGIALWKEADPSLRYDDILDIISKTSAKDEYVTADPNVRVKWGAGKFDVFEGLLEVLRRQGINSITEVSADPGSGFMVRALGDSGYQVIAPGAGSVDVRIFSLSGVQLAETSSPGNEAFIDLSDLQKGIYLMNVNGVHTKKIIVN